MPDEGTPSGVPSCLRWSENISRNREKDKERRRKKESPISFHLLEQELPGDIDEHKPVLDHFRPPIRWNKPPVSGLETDS